TKITAASPGDTLKIKGTCLGNFTVDKNLTLQGNTTATLDGNDLGTVLTISGTPTVHLIDLLITGGLSATNGGGIDHAGGPLTLRRVTVQDNEAMSGGGIYSGAGAL